MTATRPWKDADRMWREVPGKGRREVNVHHLKSAPHLFDAVVKGYKLAEFRVDDRLFKQHDIIVLYRLNSSGIVEEYSPRHAVEIVWLDGDPHIPTGYVLLSIKPITIDAKYGGYGRSYIFTSDDD